MKPDEAIEILKNMKWSITTKFNAVNNSTRALDLAISALEKQEQDRWIPVTERLPEYGQVVMWCNENGSVFSSAITYKRGDDWAIGKRHRYKSVLAWRPLPEPYTEEE